VGGGQNLCPGKLTGKHLGGRGGVQAFESPSGSFGFTADVRLCNRVALQSRAGCIPSAFGRPARCGSAAVGRFSFQLHDANFGSD
jgi:hypothetical protein